MKHIRIILALSLTFIIIIASMIWHVSRLQSELTESTAIRSAKLYSTALAEFRTFYTTEVVDKVSKHGLEISHDYVNQNNTIPLPATLSMKIGANIGKQISGATSILFSPYPFPWRENNTTSSLNKFAEKAWDNFNQTPDESYYQFLETDDQALLYYATPDVMRAECVSCHNSHPDSPKKDWKTGDIRGALIVSLPLNSITKQTTSNLKTTIVAYITIGLGLVIVITMILLRLYRQSEELEIRITERTRDLQSEITLREKMEERFRIGIEASPAAMIMVQENGKILYANLEAERLFGYPHGKLTNKLVDILVPDLVRDNHPDHRSSFLKNPSARKMGDRDLYAKKKGGEIFPVEIGITPIETSDGMLILCAVVDLSERKEFELALLESAELLKEANEQLYNDATVDSLTNIANRRGLYSQMDTFLQFARRNDQPISLLMADIDYFKQYNDDYGHPAGDKALKAVAEKINSTNRESDFAARYGGEEFAIILPNTDKEGAITVGEKLRKTIEQISGMERIITMSFGAATLTVYPDTPFIVDILREKLIKQADDALYHSKENGRNQVAHFDDINKD